MADVLIVCVREDEPQAKALAEMFEAAGFSIGGAPASDGALRSSGAGLVVWSQASIRSRPFLDAAQRVINADKAVVASLIEPPPPSSIGNSPVFDLSQWDGDANDPSLDPLFFAVDRMVNSARAAVGAPARRDPEPEPYDPPPVMRAPPPPPPRPAPRPSAPPAYTQRSAPPSEPMSTEAEHWRAIRDSRDPADFMDYLGRYGPEGAFAEVAELRLKQLTARSDPPPPRREQRPLTPPLPPPRSAAPPPRPSVRLDPPPQRREALPPRRVDPPRRNGDRDRADLRDPPKGEGGALRAFVLIALLGGAALAGGLYFGGGLPNMGPLSGASDTASTEPSPASTSAGEPADALDQPVGTPIDQASTISPSQPARRDTTRPTTPSRSAEQDDGAAAPQTSFAATSTTPSNGSTGGGPVSLRGSDNGSSSPPPFTTTAPPPNDVQVASATPPTTTVATPPRPARVGTVSYSQRPPARRIAEVYPSRAMREGVGGRVSLDCTVRPDLGLNCSVGTESPAGQDFGRAAMSASSSYRANPTLSDGSSAVGARTRLVVQFQAPQQ